MFNWLSKLFGRPKSVERWNAIPDPVQPPTRPPPAIAAYPRLPVRILFFDVETTGLSQSDRIVSFAGLLMKSDGLATGELQFDLLHIVCDPGKRSNSIAEAIHGYDDWTLRHQTTFARSAEKVEQFFNKADLVVAHHLAFDLSFVNRELLAAGRLPISPTGYCTMEAHRRSGKGGSASLTALAGRIGHIRVGHLHGAIEDSYLAMAVYLHSKSVPKSIPPWSRLIVTNPNMAGCQLDPVPPRPEGRLPNRKRGKVPPLIL